MSKSRPIIDQESTGLELFSTICTETVNGWETCSTQIFIYVDDLEYIYIISIKYKLLKNV